MTAIPNVLCLSGHDPSGGAGMHADIETVGALGTHAAGVITALTRQDTRNAYGVLPTETSEFAAQVEILMADMRFEAIKVGLVGSAAQARSIANLARSHSDLPVVLDPVLRAGGGATLADDPVAEALAEHLFRHTVCLTPNAAEARLLCHGEPDLDSCGAQLARRVHAVLITGGDEPGEEVINTWYGADGVVERYRWPKLSHKFHGAGCTLSSAIAALLARGEPLEIAISAAQEYTWEALSRGFEPGRGRPIAERLHRHR